MMLIFADRGIQSGWSADSIQSTLEGIEEKFEKCNDKLASVSVGPCSYQFQADKIEKMTQDLQILQRYAGSAPDYVWDTLDNPLYVDFKNNATESLSQIILDDFYTDNTIGMEEHFTVSQKGAVYSQKRVKETLTFSDFFGLPAVEHEDSMVTLENVETVNEFASLFRKDYDKMKEADIETCIRNYLTSGEFNHEAYHPALDFLSGLLDITIVKPVIEFFTGTDLITGERLTEAQKYQKMAGAIVDMFTFGQGLVAMKGAGLVGKELCKAFGKTMLVEVASSASAYTVGYGVEAMGLPPQIAWMLGAATGCIVSTAGMNLVFRNPKTGVVRECSLEEITSLEKLDASEIDIAKLGKEVPTDDLELYMRYQKEGSIEHFTDSEKKTISRIETMGIKGDECEEILRARGKEVTRPPIEEPEAVLPPRNESEVIESGKDSVYIPKDADGNPIPLNKQRINGQDIPLPDPAAQGRPHTVLGGKISSETGEVYRQSATFNGGSWPTANGYEVPLSEVHWTNHGRADAHTNPHQHVFNYDFDNRYWYRSDPEVF